MHTFKVNTLSMHASCAAYMFHATPCGVAFAWWYTTILMDDLLS